MTITNGRTESSYGHRDCVGVDAVVEDQSRVVRADCVGGGFSLNELAGMEDSVFGAESREIPYLFGVRQSS